MYKLLCALFAGLGLYFVWLTIEILDVIPEVADVDAERYGQLMAENSSWLGWKGTDAELAEVQEIHEKLEQRADFISAALGAAATACLSFCVSIGSAQKFRDNDNN